MEILKPVLAYALTGVVSAVASRYHLDGSQSAAVMADAIAIATGGVGVAMHWRAYVANPPEQK